MRVDFYQLTRDPVEKVVPALARKTLQAGQRMLIVGADQEQRRIIAEELWKEGPAHFLANGEAAEPHAARQPILLSDSCEPLNEARFLLLADGVWREEASAFARTFLMFGPDQTEAARGLWRDLKARAASDGTVEFGAFRQNEDGGWNPL
ncbi:DNA polymerase III subunit chi [Erythrobacter sp. A6_0]|uniref:DNA polymerase III subunit chi n=1 Tax=Erythrobacter sp. A6_0 TaxID=2821089 RepID=UPI001ADCB2A8|nr:DNA polymerase III subunit chi [Erythrobacter sp. A6_0]MBO9510103.1 DNA polymerase III subunit chi [Erythrobacter sp. A6_0]